MALWISDASDGASRERIGQIFQEKLQLVNLSENPLGGPMTSAHFSFDTHSDAFRRYEVGNQQRGRMHSSTPHPAYGGGGEGISEQMKQQQRSSASTVPSNATA